MINYIMQSQIALLSSKESTQFCQVYDLSVQYIPEALKVTKLFEQAIGSDMKFNLSLAKQIAQTEKLSVDKIIDSTIIRHNGSSSDLFNDFQAKLQNQYGITLSAKQIQTAEIVFRNAFTNLHHENSNAWIFWSKVSANKTSYHYRMMYATTKNEQEQTYLVVSPFALTITVSIITEQILCNISTSATYEVLMQGMVVKSLVKTPQTIANVMATTNFPENRLGRLNTDNSRDELSADLLKTFGLSLVRIMGIPKDV